MRFGRAGRKRLRAAGRLGRTLYSRGKGHDERGEARTKVAAVLAAQAAPQARSDLVLIDLALLPAARVRLSLGAPLDALLLGLGRTIPEPISPP